MKGKIIFGLSLILFAAFGVWVMKSLFLNNSSLLIIPEEGLYIQMAEQTFKVIESEGEPIRISLGQVSRKRAVIDILLGESTLKKEDIKLGEAVEFNYENHIYNLRLVDIQTKIVGEEKANLFLTKKGTSKNVQADKAVSTVINEIKESDFEIFLKKRKIPKRRFMRRLRNKSKRVVTFDELVEIVSDHFPGYEIREGDQYYTDITAWLKTKK